MPDRGSNPRGDASGATVGWIFLCPHGDENRRRPAATAAEPLPLGSTTGAKRREKGRRGASSAQHPGP